MHFTLRQLVLIVTLARNESGGQARATLERPTFSSAEAAVIPDPLTGEFKIGCRATGEPVVGNQPFLAIFQRLTTQCFSRGERETAFEPADLLARAADGGKPVLCVLVWCARADLRLAIKCRTSGTRPTGTSIVVLLKPASISAAASSSL